MSDTTDANLARKLAYVAAALELSPRNDGERIVAMRASALGLDHIASNASVNLHRNRRELADLVRGLRGDFWRMPIEELDRALSEFASHTYPDVVQLVARLKPIAAERDAFQSLLSDSGCDEKFSQWLRDILVLPARGTATKRQYVRETFRRPLHRKKLRRLIDRIEKETPGIFAVESEWFAQLRTQKMSWLPAASAREPKRITVARDPIPGWVIWIGTIILIGIIRSLLDAL